ncbi:hypothetical protein BCY91_09635 [Pelobium manganitolerans]|uniref:Uncharacterized protein n=1 Tax=Pelobium manganitolerans TaxID=1842495 RepID=A0A419S3E4_9SPHI|nr:hypothetical protein BCY91_09635 [Pelobium manganitolerans]
MQFPAIVKRSAWQSVFVPPYGKSLSATEVVRTVLLLQIFAPLQRFAHFSVGFNVSAKDLLGFTAKTRKAVRSYGTLRRYLF